jgi:hypothetical protein
MLIGPSEGEKHGDRVNRVSVYDNGVRCRPAFELVIFDNDGVLVDSEPHAQRSAVGTQASPPSEPWPRLASVLSNTVLLRF